MSDGGFGISAMPIYDRFITQAKKINPRFLVMIVPARWYAGGKGMKCYTTIDYVLFTIILKRLNAFLEYKLKEVFAISFGVGIIEGIVRL